jgi:hypothetical protein
MAGGAHERWSSLFATNENPALEARRRVIKPCSWRF